MKTLGAALTARLGETGLSNTRLYSQKPPVKFTFGLDTTFITFAKIPAAIDFDDITNSLQGLCSDEIARDPKGNTHDGGRKWDEVWTGLKGIRLYRDLAGDSSPGKAKVCFQGGVMSQVALVAFYEWVSAYKAAYEGKFTRFDPYIDDHEKLLPLESIEKALKAHQVRGISPDSYRIVEDGKGGKTIYAGSRESPKCTRHYDKGVESKGKIKGNRHELEAKKKAAEVAGNQWTHAMSISEEHGRKVLAGQVLGARDFVEKKDKNRSRDTQLEWWSEFIMAVCAEPVVVRAPTEEWALQKTYDFMDRQVATSLALLKVHCGSREAFHGVMDYYADNGDERLDPKKRRAAELTPLEAINL